MCRASYFSCMSQGMFTLSSAPGNTSYLVILHMLFYIWNWLTVHSSFWYKWWCFNISTNRIHTQLSIVWIQTVFEQYESSQSIADWGAILISCAANSCMTVWVDIDIGFNSMADIYINYKNPNIALKLLNLSVIVCKLICLIRCYLPKPLVIYRPHLLDLRGTTVLFKSVRCDTQHSNDSCGFLL